MSVTPSTPTTDTLTIRPWPDEVIDALGHDPRSHYVETYWLGILGPPTMAADPKEDAPAVAKDNNHQGREDLIAYLESLNEEELAAGLTSNSNTPRPHPPGRPRAPGGGIGYTTVAVTVMVLFPGVGSG